MRKSLDGWSGEVRIGGQKRSNLRFADDTILCANSESELGQMLDRVEKNSDEHNLALTKKKIMIVGGAFPLPVLDALKDFERVEKFLYLD